MRIQLQESVKTKYLLVWGAIAAATVVTFVLLLLGSQSAFPSKPVGYVVCGCLDYDPDNRLYRIDLDTGRILSISGKLAWMGRPNDIALDADRMRLYIASMRGRSSYDFFPLSVVGLGDDQGKIEKQVALTVDGDLVTATNRLGRDTVEAYSVVLSPHGREFYVSHAGLGGQWSLLDAMTGEFVPKLDVYLSRQSVFSPDGHYAWHFRPYMEGPQDPHGNGPPRKQPGISLIYDIRDGEEQSRITLSSNRDHQATLLKARQQGPWEEPAGPHVRLEQGDLVAYDRDTYKILSRVDINNLVGQHASVHVTGFDQGRRVAMVLEAGQRGGATYPAAEVGGARHEAVHMAMSHVVAMDVSSGELLFKTPIGTEIQSDYCTNIEVAYEASRQGA